MTTVAPPMIESRRACTFRWVALAATLLGMLASLKLWLTARTFPLLPLGGLPAVPAPWDAVLLGGLLLALLLAVRFHRPSVLCFLLGSLLLYGTDQNRGQPWFYLYWILLLLTLLPEATALAAARFVLSAVYIWAGVQKCGPDFQRLVVPYLMQPVSNWFPPGPASCVQWIISATPAVEIFIGVALWIPRLRLGAIALTIAVHVVALLVLGPLGHKYNAVVWPWNLAMVALVVVLFPPVSFVESWRQLRRSFIGTGIVALVTLLPLLSYSGRWDSYFSFALYSGNTATADLFITPALAERLPPELKPFAHPLHPDVVAANPELNGLWIFDIQSWAQSELGVPPVPEPRSYVSAARYVARFAPGPNDAQLLIQPRGGPPQVYRAADLK